MIRTRFIDPDFRRDPRTDHWCAVCQRDLKPGQPHRFVCVIHLGTDAVHPDDWSAAQRGDGWTKIAADDRADVLPIGADCARRLGIDWTKESPE